MWCSLQPLQDFDDAVKIGKFFEDYKCNDLAVATVAGTSSELHQEDYYVLPKRDAPGCQYRKSVRVASCDGYMRRAFLLALSS